MVRRDSEGPHFRFEKAALAQGARLIVGIDEAGRGPLAGPVVAAAVILDQRRIPRGIDDSKVMSHEQRETVYATIIRSARVGVGLADVDCIDRINILNATLQAMAMALNEIGEVPCLALVDGNRPPQLPCPVQCIIEGDAQSLSIAAASIIAKVRRDRIMCELDLAFPGYGFAQHKGYATPEHRAALNRLGPCSQHRRSFAPVREAALTIC
jgi:ribonuclease HII